MTVQAQAGARLTFREAIADLGFFSWLFALIVAGPSILSLFQSVFIDHRLIDALQWIVTGYDRVAAVLGAMFEPLVQPIIDWISARLNWDIDLHPHWRPIFILAMMILVAEARSALRENDFWRALREVTIGGAGALTGALIAGTIPTDAAWWMQALMATAPIAVGFAFYLVAEWEWSASIWLGGALVTAAFLIFSMITCAALPLGNGEGIVCLAALVFFAGVSFTHGGVANSNLFDARMGLTILGGFFAAALIIAADAALRAWGPAELAAASAM